MSTTMTQKEDAVRVGLYIVRAPASASRLQLAEDGLLKYLAKGVVPNYRCDPLFEPNGRILDPLDWIVRLSGLPCTFPSRDLKPFATADYADVRIIHIMLTLGLCGLFRWRPL